MKKVKAPVSGILSFSEAVIFTTEGEWVDSGQVIATIRPIQGAECKVVAPSRGWLFTEDGAAGAFVNVGQDLFRIV